MAAWLWALKAGLGPVEGRGRGRSPAGIGSQGQREESGFQDGEARRGEEHSGERSDPGPSTTKRTQLSPGTPARADALPDADPTRTHQTHMDVCTNTANSAGVPRRFHCQPDQQAGTHSLPALSCMLTPGTGVPVGSVPRLVCTCDCAHARGACKPCLGTVECGLQTASALKAGCTRACLCTHMLGHVNTQVDTGLVMDTRSVTCLNTQAHTHAWTYVYMSSYKHDHTHTHGHTSAQTRSPHAHPASPLHRGRVLQ